MGGWASNARHYHELALECLIRAKCTGDFDVQENYRHVGKFFLAHAYVELARKRDELHPHPTDAKTTLHSLRSGAVSHNISVAAPAKGRSSRTKGIITPVSRRSATQANSGSIGGATSNAHAHRRLVRPRPVRG